MNHVIAWALADEDGRVIEVCMDKAPLTLAFISNPTYEIFPLFEMNLRPLEFEQVLGLQLTFECETVFGRHKIWDSPSGWYFRNPWHDKSFGPYATRKLVEQGAFIDYSMQVGKCFK